MHKKLTDPGRVFITSDIHYGHRLMCRLRGFSACKPGEKPTPEEIAIMDDAITDVINSTVPADAELYIIGDFTMHAKAAQVAAYLSRINCTSVTLVDGNHDDFRSVKDAGFSHLTSYMEMSHRHDGERTMVCFSHYPMAVWNKSHHGSIMCHGHSHGNGNDTNLRLGIKRFDVGIDSFAVHDAIKLGRPKQYPALARPVTFAQIAEAAETRPSLPAFDHHTEGSN